MSCANCSKNQPDGKPAGCGKNGSCASGGCNKLEVFDWLQDLSPYQDRKQFDWIEVRFKNNRKAFYRNTSHISLHAGEIVTVEASPGKDIGIVTLTGELVRVQMKKKGSSSSSRDAKKVLRKSTQPEIDKWHSARALEYDTMLESRKIANALDLDMKIGDVEYQGDKSKATFYYIADQRVDFRELIKKLAEKFRVRIEMRQIGARQEASMIGGVGACGRELCCATWLTDFRSVSTSAARYQQLSLNPQKLAGQCGKLKCCLNYELDAYLEVFKELPPQNVPLKTKSGVAKHFKTDIFKKVMYYVYDEPDATPIAIAADRVSEIQSLNKKNKMPGGLQEFALALEPSKELAYVSSDDQDSITRFDKKKGKKSAKHTNKRRRTGVKNTKRK